MKITIIVINIKYFKYINIVISIVINKYSKYKILPVITI